MSKIIAASAFCIRDEGQKYLKNSRQRGVSLIELMVGVAIGLLVVAVAGGALMVSRGISGTVSDASLIQQQAGLVFRTIGLQVRQAGSLYLNLNPQNNTSSGTDQYALPVAFETVKASSVTNGGFNPRTTTIGGFDPSTNIITGDAANADTTLTVAYRRYREAVFGSAIDQSLSRDCLGGPAESSLVERLQSSFAFDATNNQLRCRNLTNTAQPIVSNVANFRVRYLLQGNNTGGNPTTRYVNAAGAANNWSQITGVEVCLVLYGNERMNLPTGSTYQDCDGTTNVDMASAALGAARTGRMHMVFRNTYQLRSQGLIGSVLL